MMTEQTRNNVWQELLDAARLVRYYEALSNRYRSIHRIGRLLLLAAVLGGMAAHLDTVPEVVLFVSTLLIAILVVRELISDNASKAAVLQDVSIECDKLKSAWKELWCEANDDHSDDVAVRRKSSQLSHRLADSNWTTWLGGRSS